MADIRKSWTSEQDLAIQSIVQQVGIKNWPLVSQLMKEKYQLISRSGKQCRQRWHNQLSPQLNKHPWSQEEQERLFSAHIKHGNRWIQISKQFGGRTDNSIKNHFYSTIRRSMRRICKILGNRNSTSRLRNIRPSILSQIFQFSKTHHMKSYKHDQNMDIASCLLQYAKQKPGKSSEFDPSSKDELQMLVHRLIVLNQQYVNFKNQKKKYIQPRQQAQKKYNIKLIHQTLKARSQQLSYTNSSISQEQIPQKQHNSHIVQKELQNLIGLENQKQKCSIQGDQQNFSEMSIAQSIDMQSLQDNYLIMESLHIHSMFDSTEDFNEKQHRVFHYLEKPSFQEIGCLDQFIAGCIQHDY